MAGSLDRSSMSARGARDLSRELGGVLPGPSHSGRTGLRGLARGRHDGSRARFVADLAAPAPGTAMVHFDTSGHRARDEQPQDVRRFRAEVLAVI